MKVKEIKKVLIANRGVPAVRIMHTCRDRKIPTTAVYSTPDRLAHHVFMADTAVHIGDAPPIESYLNMNKMIEAAPRSKSDAIHPGWGFLAENEEFARRVTDARLIWIGPSPEVIRMMGDKVQAKYIAQRANVPTIPGLNDATDIKPIKRWMREEKVRFPIMIKAAAGGGKGMMKVEKKKDALEFIEFRERYGEAPLVLPTDVWREGPKRPGDRVDFELWGKPYTIELVSIGAEHEGVIHVVMRVNNKTRVYKVETPMAKRAEIRMAKGPNDVGAPINGNIWRIGNPDRGPLKVGDIVHKGEEIANLEAMKMENAITAPFDGQIIEICIKLNDSVQEGQLLFVLEKI